MDLEDLLVDVNGLSNEELEIRGRELYIGTYIDRGKLGVIQSHDGEDVIFWPDRFEHAFFSSDEKISNPFKKDTVELERVKRIRWIGEFIKGNANDLECWSIGNQRLYVSWAERYIVWLEPRKEGGWKFSSAYQTTSQNIRRYTKRGRKIWDN